MPKQAIPKLFTGTSLITQKNADSITAQTTTLRTILRDLKVTTNLQCQEARALLTRVLGAKQKAQLFLKPILDNAKEGLRLAKQQETELVGPLLEVEKGVRSKINLYLTELETKRREAVAEQQRLKEEHERKVLASKRPERLKPMPVVESPVEPVLENTAVPMVPKYEIEDETIIPDYYLMKVVDREKLWNVIRTAHKEKRTLVIPGVRIWEEASLQVRK